MVRDIFGERDGLNFLFFFFPIRSTYDPERPIFRESRESREKIRNYTKVDTYKKGASLNSLTTNQRPTATY